MNLTLTHLKEEKWKGKNLVMDYASEETRALGEKMIAKELDKVTNPRVKERAAQNLVDINEGKRDFRF